MESFHSWVWKANQPVKRHWSHVAGSKWSFGFNRSWFMLDPADVRTDPDPKAPKLLWETKVFLCSSALPRSSSTSSTNSGLSSPTWLGVRMPYWKHNSLPNLPTVYQSTERKVSRVGAWPSPSATVVSGGIFTIFKPAFRPVGNLRLVSRRTVKQSSTNLPNQKSDTRTNRSRIRCKFAMYCVSRNSNSGPMLQLT